MKKLTADSLNKIARVSVAGLECFLENNLNGIRVLSLDCFDTLLWRKLSSPKDVFYELQQNKYFRDSGMSAARRATSASRLRRIRHVQGESTELSLVDIYRHALPSADNTTIQALVEAELSTERDLCFIFKPVFKLLEIANKLGVKTMVVSDTYLSGPQLTTLIEHCMKKAGVSTTIDHVFASSDWGVSKANGLFGEVLNTIRTPPYRVVHLGDNVRADHDGAREAGVQGFLFDQFYPSVKSAMSDLERVSQIMLPRIRDTYPMTCRWKSAWAKTDDNEPSGMVGKYTLGPVLYNFIDWIANHVEQLKREGEKPRLIFLLRDGHASYLAAKKFSESDPRLSDVPITELEASRFVAFASTFTNRGSIVAYLAEHARSPSYEAVLNQLLFTEDEAREILGRYERNQEDLLRFCAEVSSDSNASKIVNRSREFRRRFYKRINKVVGVEAGETLLLVDLGYNGTVHTLLSPVLSADFNVRCQGIFFGMSATTEQPTEKYGLISADNCDHRLLSAIFKHIRVFEQINANSSPSTVGFADDGLPIFSREVIPKWQIALREDIQHCAIEFVSRALIDGVPPLTSKAVADETLSLIGRFLFLPSKKEIPAFDGALHDVNLGTEETELMMSTPITNKIMRKRGLMGLAQTQRNGVFWELRSRDIGDALNFLNATRFELPMNANDYKAGEVSVIVHTENGMSKVSIPAYKTEDEFLRLLVPVNRKIQAIGVMLAMVSKWIQVESVSLIKVATAFAGYRDECLDETEIPCSVRFEVGIERGTGIVEFSNESGFVFITPNDVSDWAQGDSCCEIIFRPLTISGSGG